VHAARAQTFTRRYGATSSGPRLTAWRCTIRGLPNPSDWRPSVSRKKIGEILARIRSHAEPAGFAGCGASREGLGTLSGSPFRSHTAAVDGLSAAGCPTSHGDRVVRAATSCAVRARCQMAMSSRSPFKSRPAMFQRPKCRVESPGGMSDGRLS
jgi:hypothetical protein